MRTCANYLSTVKDVVVSISDMKKSRYACGLCEKPYAYKQDATNEMLQGTRKSRVNPVSTVTLRIAPRTSLGRTCLPGTHRREALRV